MQLNLLDKKSKVDVSDAVFAQEFNEPLVHQVVTAYLAGARRGTATQKTRSEVSGGGKKPWKQKGTGRARAGSSRSPLWRGGGVTFASKPRSYKQKVNKKMYTGAVRSMFSELVRKERLAVIEKINLKEAKTKLLAAELKKLKLERVLIVTDKPDEMLALAARNLPHVAVCTTFDITPVLLISHSNILLTVDAVKKIEEWLA